MRGPGATLLIALVLAGCVDVPAGDLDDGDITSTAIEPVLSILACPPGDTFERAPGVCVSTLAPATQSLQEPELAIHPVDPDVLAIGVNAGHLVDVDPAAPVDLSPMRADVYLSQDGGATWTHLRPPVPLLSQGRILSADTNPLFDRDGTLHVSGIAITAHPGDVIRQSAYYTSSRDMGKTWSEPVVFLDSGDDDRNWNTLAPDGAVIVAWQRYMADKTEIAWTRDGGASFERLTIEDCSANSPVVFHGGLPLVACSADEIDLYSLDLSAGSASLVASTGVDGYIPLLARAADGSLWMAPRVSATPQLARSADGGASWSEPIGLAEALGLSPGRTEVRWLAADPWGGIHVMVEELPERCPSNGLQRILCQSETLLGGASHHATFDATGEVTTQTRLTPEGTRAPPTAVPGMLDDFHALAFAPDHGVMVWTFEKGLDVTRVERATG